MRTLSFHSVCVCAVMTFCTCVGGSTHSSLSWLVCTVAPVAVHVPTCHDLTVLHLWLCLFQSVMTWLCWLHLSQHTLRPVMTWLCCCTCEIMFQLAMTWLCCCACGSAHSKLSRWLYCYTCSIIHSNLSWLGCVVAPIAAHVPTCHDGSVYIVHLRQHVFQPVFPLYCCTCGSDSHCFSIYVYGFVIQVSKKVTRISELISLLKFYLVNCFLFHIPHCFVLLMCVCVCVCICRMLVPSLERVVPTSRGWGLTWVVCLVALAVPCAGGHIIQSLQSIVAFEREGERGKQQVKKRQSLSNLYALKKKFKKILESVVAATRWASSQPATHSQHPNRICHVMCYREIQSSLPHQWCSFYIEALFDCCCTLLAESW